MNNNYSAESLASFTDEKLAALAQGGDDRAFDYRVLVRKKSSSYYIIGADRDDIIQEGMIGLFKAVRDFDPGREASFKTFADICVSRQMLTAVKNALRQKHAPLNFYVSLNKPIAESDGESELADVFGGNETANPEDIVINREKADCLEVKVNEALSRFELRVLSLYLQGNSYLSIGKAIGKDSKSVDNAIQRIRKKIERISL